MLRMIFNVFAAKYYEIAYIDKIDLNFAAILDNLLVAMVGIANAAHQYVPISISITSAENTKSAVDILRWVRENSHARTKSVLAWWQHYPPHVLLSYENVSKHIFIKFAAKFRTFF